MTYECPDPIPIPATCNILCTSQNNPLQCDTAYMWEELADDFTIPAIGGSGNITVCNSAQYAIGAYVWLRDSDGDGGLFEVVARPNTQTLTIQNNGTTGNSVATTVINAETPIVQTVPPFNYTTFFFELTSAGFAMPAAAATVNITVANSANYAVGMWIWIEDAGYFELTAIPDSTTITLTNSDCTGNTAPAAAVATGKVILGVGRPEKARWLEGSDTWDPGSINDGAEEAKEVTVTGAALGDFALASFSLDVADLVLNAQVTAADTVTCVLANNTGGAIDLASGTVRVRVFPM